MSTTAAAVKAETKTKKPVAVKAETKKVKVAEHKVEVNGSYEFLVKHFHAPSTIIDAATALAEHSKIDPNIAVKKVETFLENAKVDRTLEVKAGTGSNEGQFLIARVPQSAQRKNGGREVKKAAVAKTVIKTAKDAGHFEFIRSEVRSAAAIALSKSFLTIAAAAESVAKTVGVGVPVARAGIANILNVEWMAKHGWAVKKRDSKDGNHEYHLAKL